MASDALLLRTFIGKWILHLLVSVYPTAYSRGNNLNHLFGTGFEEKNHNIRGAMVDMQAM